MISEIQRQIALSALGVATGLASILLVFVAFVYGKSESIEKVQRARQYKNVARGGFIPFALSMATAWLALNCLQTGAIGTYDVAIIGLRVSMIATALYAFVVVFIYL